jgi:PIN domain nuclease of toxin-antitoxin system
MASPLLLDTCALLWLASGDGKLSAYGVTTFS